MAFRYHICAGCRRAHERRQVRFPFTCDCGWLNKAPRSAEAEGWGDGDGRPRDGSGRVLPTPHLE